MSSRVCCCLKKSSDDHYNNPNEYTLLASQSFAEEAREHGAEKAAHFVDGYNETNNRERWSVKGGVEGIASNQTSKKAIVTVETLANGHKMGATVLTSQ